MDDSNSELSDNSYNSDEGSWSEEETNEPESPAKCLFCNSSFGNVELALIHCKEDHGIDFYILMKKFHMDCYSFIKMINFIRKESVSYESFKILDTPLWSDDIYLKPVEEYDPWLMFDFEEYFQSLPKQVCSESSQENMDLSSTNNQLINQLQKELLEKNEHLFQLKEQLLQMKNFVHTLLQDDDKVDTHPTTTSNDTGYFDSYSHHGIHHDMLSDNVRTISYKNAILENKTAFAEKTVLDLGCGTGILSMFAASAGAKKVYAIDYSDIAFFTVDIIRENKMTNKIEVIKSRIENDALPFHEVDIIVSEWMGYFLLFEGMLDSLIYARDRFLKSDGLILPDKCNLYICGASDIEGFKNHVEFWNNVHGYQMSCIRNEVLKEVIIDVMPSKNIVTSASKIASFDLYKCSVEDTNFTSSFELTSSEDTTITAFVGYFDVIFDLEINVQFSTDSFSTDTHWKQTLFYISNPIHLKKGEVLAGTLSCRRNTKNSRFLAITIEVRNQKYTFDLQ